MKYYSTKKKNGFTLVELLIAIAVFSVVVTFSLGSVVAILNAGRKARSLASVMTNLNSTIEVMSREITFGTHYHCVLPNETVTFPPGPQNCSGSPNAAQPEIAFVTSDGVNTLYKQAGSAIQKSTDGGATWIAVTAPEVNIQSLQFYVFGSYAEDSSAPDEAQPRVIVVVRGTAGVKASVQSNFVLQTMLSQRVLDLSSTGGGSAIPPPPPTSYRYVRWVITKKESAVSDCSGTGLGCIQVQELVLQQNGTTVPWPAGSVATNPGGSNPGTQTPPKAIDASNATKWLDFNFAGSDHQTGSSEFDVDTGVGNSVLFNGYYYVTGDDTPSRDPVSWTLSGSNDKVTWTVLSSESDQTIPSGRKTNTQSWSF